LSNRYHFEQRLGKGGMGIVYKALDKELDRKVAVKLVHPDLTGSIETHDRFKREAKSAASLTHPNIVTVHDFGVSEDGRAYLVMELLQGITLRQELHRRGPLNAQRSVRILSNVCAAVEAAHAQGILHRDLKPENIFLIEPEGEETAKILDFGVAKQILTADALPTASQTGPGMLLGTLSYMSPEQLRGDKAAESWDVWALSVVAYEMIAGVHPFADSSALGVYDAIRSGRMTPLNRHLPGASPEMQSFFEKTLSLEIGLRPSSTRQFFDGFSRLVH
jgi:serine/threonine-protein kinase